MKLNARQVETAKPAEKDYKLPDGNGLILLVKTSGAKYRPGDKCCGNETVDFDGYLITRFP